MLVEHENASAMSWNYIFYLVDSYNATPVFPEIYYNIDNNSYGVNGSAESFVLDPNLSFPSLGLILANPVIPV